MSLEENKVIVRKMFEAINNQDLSSLEQLMAPDFILNMENQQTRGWEVNRKVIEGELKAFPDFHVILEDIIAEGNLVCVRLQETGTHLGEYRGLSPTGNKVSYTVVAIWRIIGGKIVEGWIVYDQLNFLQQLGAIDYENNQDEKVS